MAGVEEEGPLEALPVAGRGLVRWWRCAGARARHEADAVYGISPASDYGGAVAGRMV